jgi:hypothetical protein
MQVRLMAVMDHQDGIAFRAHIQQFFHGMFGPAAQAPVKQLASGLGNEMGTDMFGKQVSFHF